MYSYEALTAFPYFRDLLASTPLPQLHDSLTGLLARPVILGFLRALLEEGRPLALMIVDLDNFKSINDNYGHRTGDEMLSRLGRDLRETVGDRGLAGRYGGDEFLIVFLGDTGYDSLHRFLSGLYGRGGVFRRDVTVRGRTIFSTATVGCAVYPKDADSFEELFAQADKTLYRGKSKGRNCFIIYVAEKHAHLVIPDLARHSLYDTLYRMAGAFDRGRDPLERLRLAFRPLEEYLRFHRLLYVDAAGQLWDVAPGLSLGPAGDPSPLLKNGLYTARSLRELELCCPPLAERLGELGFESVLLSELRREGTCLGCLVLCPEAHTLHIWQEQECAAAFFLSRLLAQSL